MGARNFAIGLHPCKQGPSGNVGTHGRPESVTGSAAAPLDARFREVIAGMIGKENNSRKRD